MKVQTVIKNKETNTKGSARYINPVSLGTLYFSFSLLLWSSDQISNWWIKGVAIFITIVSFAYFTSVFLEYLLLKLNKWVKTPLLLLTFLIFLFSYSFGWVQVLVETSGYIQELVAYFGFAWIVAFLLTLIRDTVKQGKNKRLFSFLIIATLFIIAGIQFYGHDFWSGAYLLAIAGLALAVAMNWLKVHGGIFE